MSPAWSPPLLDFVTLPPHHLRYLIELFTEGTITEFGKSPGGGGGDMGSWQSVSSRVSPGARVAVPGNMSTGLRGVAASAGTGEVHSSVNC